MVVASAHAYGSKAEYIWPDGNEGKPEKARGNARAAALCWLAARKRARAGRPIAPPRPPAGPPPRAEAAGLT